MTSIPHLQAAPTRARPSIPPEFWPSLTITAVWLAVLFDAIFGPDIRTSNGAGTNTSSTPSAVVLALFAFLTSWVIARHAFPRSSTS